MMMKEDSDFLTKKKLFVLVMDIVAGLLFRSFYVVVVVVVVVVVFQISSQRNKSIDNSRILLIETCRTINNIEITFWIK